MRPWLERWEWKADPLVWIGGSFWVDMLFHTSALAGLAWGAALFLLLGWRLDDPDDL